MQLKNAKSENMNYISNRDKIIEYQKQRYKENREDKIKYQKEYNAAKGDELKDYNKEYYEMNKSKILAKFAEKVICSCGKKISKGNLNSHKKTNLHIKRMKQMFYENFIIIDECCKSIDVC